ncbi:hypothetical protein F5141DRAFT_1213059 [Pisolithus sp. B1]|nr:hypothetical protein F5141DRAFT_1213059 [Pisolithus sp. B1]
MYNGFDWHDCTLEVCEDRYNGLSGPFHDLEAASVPVVSVAASEVVIADLYADYPGPDSSHGGLRMDNRGGYGNSNGGGGSYVGSGYEPEPGGSQSSVVDGKRASRRAI